MSNAAAFASEAQALLGPRGFTCDPELLEPWLTDWRGRFTGKALGLASPASTEQVSQFVKLCAKHNVPVVPQGGNSGMVGGATPDKAGNSVLLSLRRMNQVRQFDVSGKQIIVDAGLVLQTLHEIVEAEHLRFPLTLGGKGSATIGGLISTNAGGTQVLRHGTMRAQVVGIEAVLADGQIFDALTALKKDNRGFDLKQLLIGSEGTLGIVTGATLKLAPAMADRVVAWVGLKSIHAARELLVKLETHLFDELEGFEVMPAHCLSSVLQHLPDARNPLEGDHAWHALLELAVSGNSAQSVRDQLEALLAEELEAQSIADAVIAANEKQAEDFWLLRDSVAPAEKEIGPAVQHDISVPVAKMPDFIETAGPALEARFPGTKSVSFGHLGDGNVHFHVLAPPGAVPGEWEDGEGKLISAMVYDLTSEWGGSISAEHGIGQMKIGELARLNDPVSLQLMRSVKLALDPQGILNPGKLVAV